MPTDKRSQWTALHPEHTGLLMRWEANDVISNLAAMIGAKGYTQWARDTIEQLPENHDGQAFYDLLEAKLLQLHGVHARSDDEAMYERLDEEFQAARSEASFLATVAV